MTNKALAYGLFASIGVAIFTLIFETSLGFQTSENLFILSGIGLLVFGIWAGIRLNR